MKQHPSLSVREKQLLLDLLESDPGARLRLGTEVVQAISDATTVQKHRFTTRLERPLVFGVSLSPTSPLTRAIVETSGKKIGLSDYAAQLAFIEDDVNGDVEVIHRLNPFEHYVVHGRKLSYRVQAWRDRRTGGQTWEVGYCGIPDVSAARPNDVSHTAEGRLIRVRFAPDLARPRTRIRQTAMSWNEAFPAVDTQDILDTDQKLTHDFFRVTNQLDAVLTAAQIWPVSIEETLVEDGRVHVGVTPVIEPAREALANYLDLPSPAVQMETVFANDEAQEQRTAESEYVLEDEGILGRSDRETNVAWRFDYLEDSPNGRLYFFSHEDTSGYCPSGTVYLSPRSLAGSSAQLRRRHRAIEAMRNHATLLTAIADPKSTKRNTHEDPGLTPLIEKLDGSKQKALHDIWKTQPLYTLQGPPGTGKTELIRTFIARLLQVEPAQQILVTAHAHDAVNHIDDKVRELAGDDGPLGPAVLVRLDDDTEKGVSGTALELGRRIANCPFVKACPPHISKRAVALGNLDAASSEESRGFQALVRQAANVVFATSNSGELARTLESERRFDWSILEEAGKAHGFDLAMSLQASHRTLMIGDQRQLPPFNVRQLEKLLSEPARILGALRSGIEFAPAFVDRPFVEASAEEPADFASKCLTWRRMVRFFEAMYESCEATNEDGMIIADRLTQQHRMHPTIAGMIRECFYPEGLDTAPAARERFEREPDSFEFALGSTIPMERIVFVDVPWVQKVKGAIGESGGTKQGRRYTSQVEAEAVIRILRMLRAREGGLPEVQILSPYRAQVELIRERMLEEIERGGLRDLAAFRFVGNRYGATVDEFQGNEADVVIVSLVRNNAAPVGSGVGFLSEEPRVNVLLSRAKRKLIMVGSWDFLASRVPNSAREDDEHPLAHIRRVMSYLKSGFDRGDTALVKFEQLSGSDE